tara:strand:+ start:1887 stop:2342 length:456 start_codon:yes stop_codon:yes gene_type:complete
MKLLYLFIAILFSSINTFSQSIEYKVITSIESIIPGGVGRSRIIQNNQEINHKDFTTYRIDGKDERKSQGIKRKGLKIDDLSETKLLNFYSIAGINFQNIASNDALITSVINQHAAEGWALDHVVSGVESDAGEKDGNGIFITRYIFKRSF